MSRERFIERLAEVKSSTQRLSDAVSQPESELVRDATIQRFEFTFEVVWKALKLYLEHQGNECPGPRPTLKKAFAASLIPTEEESAIWLAMLEDRNLSSHAYDEGLARRIYANIVRDYAATLAEMSRRLHALTWE
jgi:nucleotidyltransferase substrate binding protein (TIGR01987 family)